MVRTRFAPSPTGYLHIGGVRTALFNWLFARQHGGQFILRIDDTDRERNVDEALQPILDGFRWLGIDWDEGPQVEGPHAPYYQSQRSDSYQLAVAELLQEGLAYRDFARPEEVQAERDAAQQEKQHFVYSRRWLAANDEQARHFAAEGRAEVVRLKMPRTGTCQIQDLIRGQVEFEWAHEQDHVIRRADGTCLYHLANVVDDQAFEISHVIRAEEHLSNTPRQIFIAQGLGFDLPQYAHLPYVAEPGGTAKISKRKLKKYLKNRDFKQLFEHGVQIARATGVEPDAETFNPVIVDFYRAVGYLPEALINYLVLLGWSLDDKTEEFTRDEMIRCFSLDRVNRSPASFDPQKLWAFQHRQMQAHPIKQKVALAVPFLQRAGLIPQPPPCDVGPRLTHIIEAAGDRLKTAGDILDFGEFFQADDQLCYDSKAFDKRLRKPGAAEQLAKFLRKLEEVEPFEASHTEAALRAFTETENVKIGEIIHPLRVAATGKGVGLGMFDALAILGRQSTVARIQRALRLI